MNMLVDPSRHEVEPSAVKAYMAPQAGGIEAVIQQAVEHVTAFSASLEQRRAEAQLEQALTVCCFNKTLLHVSRIEGSFTTQHTHINTAARTQKRFSTGRKMNLLRQSACWSVSCEMSRLSRSVMPCSMHSRCVP